MPFHRSAADAARAPSLAWVSLVIVYLFWGSTYLAIRVAVRDLPPLTLAGLRYLTAGLLLLPVARRLGGPLRARDRTGRAQWLAAAAVGLLLLVCGNGGLSIGEGTLDSGLASVLVATVPLFMNLFAWPLNHVRPTGWTLAGLAVGLIGVAVLAGGASGSGHMGGIAIVLGASAAWGFGSVLAGRLPLPRRTLVAAAMEMVVAGAVMVIIDLARGRLTAVDWASLPLRAWASLVYLIVFGSVLAFAAYAYALARLPITTVSTYAYVNPLVAVLLGALLLDETLSVHELAGAALVVVSVVLSLHAARARRRRATQEHPVLAPPPTSSVGNNRVR